LHVDQINPFIESATRVLEQIAQISSRRGQLGLRDAVIPRHEVAVILGIVGQVKGQVSYSMSMETAMRIASQMMGGFHLETFDDMSRSAISELGNMITGNASALLEEKGIRCNISPPTLVTGENMSISTAKLPTLVVPLETDCGPFEICVGLMET